MWVLIFVTSSGVGLAWRLRKERAKLRSSSITSERATCANGALDVVVDTAGSSIRQAALTALGGVRRQSLAAFRKTAQQRAPVPLTFLASLSRNFPVIFGTSFSMHLCWWSLGKLGWTFYKSCDTTITDETKRRIRLEAGAHIVCFGTGAIGYFHFLDRWVRGPMRGGLEVFATSPSLNQCAESERYLMEKLALLSFAGFEKVASIAQIGRLTGEQ
eukprot:CAMPEP_0118928368 /NCGR_PEP_ID=MMETSP1169-20130426/5632_1 /TAXON_ID=36882 /ORGANISM="Pyramimonas obovata, Strain CCMP722" /LENGTH=215 /DNA_ID=CAMNT_0006870319 /DNA_START=183 /DNA_END=827 /DNA_ORIENTATION=-